MDEIDKERIRERRDYFNRTCVSLLVVGFLFGIHLLIKGEYRQVLIAAIVFAVSLTLLLIQRITCCDCLYRVTCVLLSLFLLAHLWGVQLLTDYFWVFLFPLTYYSLLGKREGLIWTISFLALVSFVMIYRAMIVNEIIAPTGVFTVISVYFLVLIIQMRYTRAQERIFQILYEQNRQLEADKLQIAEAKDEIRQLSAILPVCSHCRKVRDEDGRWQGLDRYIVTHTTSEVTHGLCPDCLKELYPDIADEILRQKRD